MLFHLFSVLHEVWDDILRTAGREYGAVMRKRTGKRREMPISTAAFKCALFVFGVIAPSLNRTRERSATPSGSRIEGLHC